MGIIEEFDFTHQISSNTIAHYNFTNHKLAYVQVHQILLLNTLASYRL